MLLAFRCVLFVFSLVWLNCNKAPERCARTPELEPKSNRFSSHELLASVFTKVSPHTLINAVTLLLWCVKNKPRIQQSDTWTQLGKPVVFVQTSVVSKMNIRKTFLKSVTAHGIRNYLLARIVRLLPVHVVSGCHHMSTHKQDT